MSADTSVVSVQSGVRTCTRMYQLPRLLHFPSALLALVRQTISALVVPKLNKGRLVSENQENNGMQSDLPSMVGTLSLTLRNDPFSPLACAFGWVNLKKARWHPMISWVPYGSRSETLAGQLSLTRLSLACSQFLTRIDVCA